MIVPVRRLPGWRAALDAHVAAMRHVPFAWGSCDCGRFAAGGVLAVTGVDLLPEWAREYNDQKTALKALSNAGYASLGDVAAGLLPEIAPAAARIGDLMAIPTGDAFGDALGIVNGERVLVVAPAGIDSRDRGEARRAFRVGQ